MQTVEAVKVNPVVAKFRFNVRVARPSEPNTKRTR